MEKKKINEENDFKLKFSTQIFIDFDQIWWFTELLEWT